MRKLSTREQMAYRTIATLELERDAAMSREAALREELDNVRDLHLKQCCVFCNDTGNLRAVHADLQQRLTVAEQLLRETSDYLDGSTRNAVWCDSILHKKMKAALKPAAEGEGNV